MSAKKRIEELDIIKAVGIICMVAGHSSAPFKRFIYLFHMAIFFIASGFVYKSDTSRDIQSVIKGVIRKIQQLWIPFFTWNAIYVLLHNIFIDINIYTDNPQIFDYIEGPYIRTYDYYTLRIAAHRLVYGAMFSCKEQIFGANWFLKVLFLISVMYLCVDYFAKRVSKNHVLRIQFFVSVVLLIVGFNCFVIKRNFYDLAKVASFYCLYFIGHIISGYKEKFTRLNWKHNSLIFITSFVILVILNHYGEISLSMNSYKNPIFLLVASISGWAFLYSSSFFIKRISQIKNLMICIGRNTLPVLCCHLLFMKIIITIIVAQYSMPSFCVAAFPNLYGERHFWWLAYTVVGVGLPVLASELFKKTKKRFAALSSIIRD